MKLHIIARGRIGQSPEADLVQRYAMRLKGRLAITEVSESAPWPVPGQPPAASRTVVMDERGKDLGSADLAAQLARWRDDGARECRFLIGAADGHQDGTRHSADLLLGFGRATWPHMLVRAMLAEQLYRALSILDGHPYHRA
ncbi:23S rRNA (pseudouridine(1915)-N(3))-methyltransferase RlmH [Sandarakinorhabdus sp.]|uniref:23S rRNA (pseudouridine(1915)-N(3))-methyltransferase RlmH n=1 Tax=Sandarakinorhabdus sp. TaxID=1916663 RepID=UPI00333FD1F0